MPLLIFKWALSKSSQIAPRPSRSIEILPTLTVLSGYAKYFIGRSEETEAHVQEAIRLSPRDTLAYLWLGAPGYANISLGADEEAVAWLRRSVDANRNFPLYQFFLAAALGQLGRLDEARSAVQAGLALNPTFTISRFRVGAPSDNPTFLAQRERLCEGMRKAGVPEE